MCVLTGVFGICLDRFKCFPRTDRLVVQVSIQTRRDFGTIAFKEIEFTDLLCSRWVFSDLMKKSPFPAIRKDSDRNPSVIPGVFKELLLRPSHFPHVFDLNENLWGGFGVTRGVVDSAAFNGVLRMHYLCIECRPRAGIQEAQHNALGDGGFRAKPPLF